MKLELLHLFCLVGICLSGQINDNIVKSDVLLADNMIPFMEGRSEVYPRFPGCEDIAGSDKEKEECTKGKMNAYIYENLVYPEIAKKNRIEGMAIVQFTITENGKMEDARIVKNLEGGCGESALELVEGMKNLPQKWTPGRQRGRNVKVLYTLPVRFKLQD